MRDSVRESVRDSPLNVSLLWVSFSYAGLFFYTCLFLRIWLDFILEAGAEVSEGVRESQYESSVGPFSHTGLFPYTYVSFDIQTSCFIYIRLFSHTHISFDTFGSLSASKPPLCCAREWV